MDFVVTKQFRTRVLKLFPSLDKGERLYLRLLGYLAFGRFVDRTTGRLVIDHDTVREIAGVEPGTRAWKTFQSGAFLDGFRRKGFPAFEYDAYDPVLQRARQVLDRGFTPEVQQLVKEEIMNVNTHAPKVTLAKGVPLDDEFIDVGIHVPRSVNEAQSRVMEYMNRLPSNGFARKVKQNYTAAVALAFELDPEEFWDARTLHAVGTRPQPIYAPSRKGNSVRLFPINASIPQLGRQVKERLIDGWITFDLRAAQLAIVSTTWDIPRLRHWLQDGGDPWTEFATLLPAGMRRDEVKAIFKDALYATVYGASRTRIDSLLAITLDDPAMRSSFFAHWIIKEVLAARSRTMKQIVADGGAYDCFGGFMKCTDGKPADELPDDDVPSGNVRSLLACLSQAVELRLLAPVIELAERNQKHFRVMLWEHDGFSVAITKNDETWCRRIREAVDAACRAMNVPTCLEQRG